MLSLARVLSLISGRLMSPVPPSGIPNHLMFVVLSSRLSFALNSKLASSDLLMDSSYCPASLCTSELCKEGTIKFQLYCILRYYCVYLLLGLHIDQKCLIHCSALPPKTVVLSNQSSLPARNVIHSFIHSLQAFI